MNYSFLYAILVLCCIQVVLTKHTLHVDTIVPSSGSTITLKDVNSEVLYADSADVQFIEVDRTKTTGLVVDTQGPTTFGGSSISFDSTKSVDLSAGSTLLITTPETLSLTGQHWNLAADRFFSNVGGDFFLNTEGSITGHAWDTEFTAVNDVDLHVAKGVFEALAAEEFKIVGDQIEIVGDDKISLYSYSNLNVEAVGDFSAYADFIDFDSYGNIHLTSATGNIELDSVFHSVFEGDVIIASAPEGIDLKTEHGSIYINSKDEVTLNSAETVYLDIFDEAHFLTDQLFSINANTFSAVVGEKFEFNAKTAEIAWGIASIFAYNINVNTGGNIVLSLGGLTGNSQYNFNALEHIEFTSRNIFGNSDRLLVSARQDMEIEVQDRIGSELLINSESEVLLYAGRNLASRNSRFDFQAGETRVTGDSISFSSVAIVEDELNFNAGQLFQANGKSIIGTAETGIWNVDSTTAINAGTFVFTAGLERDDLLFIQGKNQASLLSNTLVSVQSKLGQLLFESSAIQLTHTAGSSFTSRESTIILAPTAFVINAGTTATIASNEAVYEMNDLTFNARSSVNFDASWFDLWASGAGIYTAGDSINWNAEGEVNIRAFADIVIENILSLNSPVVNFEAVESADFTGRGGITFSNTATFDLLTGSRSDFTFDGNKVIVSAATSVAVESGFVSMFAENNLIFSGVNDFSIDTTYEESVHFITFDTYTFSTTGTSTFSSNDDILINQYGTGSTDVRATSSIIFNAVEGTDWSTFGTTDAVVTGDITFNSFLDTLITSGGGLTLDAATLTYTIDRDIVSNSQGDFLLSSSAVDFNSLGDISFVQSPAIGNDEPVFGINSKDLTFKTTGSFSQSGGTTSLSTADFDWQSSRRILHSSIFSSTFDVNGKASDIFFDASVTNGTIRIESDDFHALGDGELLQQGGLIDYSSTDSEPIRFTGQTTVDIVSNNDSPIIWTAVEDWNVTALAGLEVLSHNKHQQKVGILIDNKDDIMSDTSFITRNGQLEIHSLLTQLFQSEEIEFIAGRDIHWSNFYSPADVGAVSITSEGSEHDGYYEDEVGIVVRSILPFGTIDFNVPRGQIDVNSGYDLREVIGNSASNFTADDEITFWSKQGYFHLKAAQGHTLLNSEHQSVTFTTNKNTEIKSHDSYSVIAGKEIKLISNDPITDPNNDLSFEFSANNGNIKVINQAGFDINFHGNDFYTTSAENSTFLASDNIPIVSHSGGISANGDTGLYKTVHNGDLYLTAAHSINLASDTNSDIRVISGQNSNWSAGDKINITSEINGFLRSARGNILLRTNDTTGDLQINSQGEIKFQADGAAGNNQHGIFVVAPEISTTADRATTVDAEVAITIGSVTRPIIQFEAGGDSKQNGVTFTSEGNVLQNAGFDFLMNANGYFNVHTQKDLSFTSAGSASIQSLGTHAHGKNVVLESDGELKLTAGNIQINGEEGSVVRGDELVHFKTTGNDPSLSYISINVVNDLIVDVNDTIDINSANWNTVATDYYNVYTFGAVEFENPTGSGSINIAADTFLLFSSNVDMDWKTILPGASISLSSLGSNSNMEFDAFNDLSDILFETNNTMTITALDDFNLESTHTASITAPMTKTGKSDNSNINFNSVDDIIYESGFDLFVQSINNLTISATDPGGAEIDIDSDGELLMQSWQNSFYTSLTNEISFIADYNITFRTEPGQGGSILLNSTRDIVTSYQDGSGNQFALGDIDGDFTLTAGRTFEVENVDVIFLESTGFDSNILFDTKTGKINVDVGFDFLAQFGETHTLANSLDWNVLGDIDLSTSGIHNSIDFISDQGLVTFDSNDDFFLFTGAQDYNRNYDIESRNGNGYIDWQARGGTSFSIQIAVENFFDIDSSAYTNIWSAGVLNVTTTDDITFSNGFYDGKVIVSANSPGGNAEFYAFDEINIENNAAEGDINFFASHEIGIFPFDDLTFSADGSSTDALNSGIVFETDHPLADLVMFTTDFLTADININAEAYNSYSRDATTYLLLDDDDTQFVGTYSFDAVNSIKFSAESDITVQETSSGDIQIDTVGGRTYFTAGGNIIMNVREQLLIDVSRGINVDTADDINFVQQQMTITTTSGDISFIATDDIAILDYDLDFTSTSPNILISLDADDDDVDSHSYDITLGLSSPNNDMSITATGAVADIFLTGPPSTGLLTTVDFRHGLVIPLRQRNSAGGAVCTQVRDFYYDTQTDRFCMCTGTNLICRQAYGITSFSNFA